MIQLIGITGFMHGHVPVNRDFSSYDLVCQIKNVINKQPAMNNKISNDTPVQTLFYLLG